ncbi:MAG: putative metal-binding motif-containing protein, partial [Myxococcota bacterium]
MTARLSTTVAFVSLLGCSEVTPEPEPTTEPATDELDADADGFPADEDCNDADATIRPDAPEICDGVDNDCDGQVDDADDDVDASSSGTLYYADVDGDGFGNADQSEYACTAPEGWVADGTDCDDAVAGINPAAPELCDGLDNDCSTETPETGTVGWTPVGGSLGAVDWAALPDGTLQLQEAGELLFCPGTFRGDVVIDGAEVTVRARDGVDSTTLISRDSTDAAAITATNEASVTVREITLTSSQRGVSVSEGASLTLRGVELDGRGDPMDAPLMPIGIVLSGAGEVELDGVTLTDFTTAGVAGSADGVTVRQSTVEVDRDALPDGMLPPVGLDLTGVTDAEIEDTVLTDVGTGVVFAGHGLQLRRVTL